MPRFMLLQDYSGRGMNVPTMAEWTPEDIKAHIEFQYMLNKELTESGELIDAQGLAGPEQAKFVSYDGVSAPIVSNSPPVATDGPYAEAKELLAGFRMIDVESEARAIEIAAKASAAPGPDGVPLHTPIEVRQVMGAPDIGE